MSLSRRLAPLVVVACASLAGATPLSFSTTELPWAAIGSDYHAAVHTLGDGRCALADVVLSVADGVLPDGLKVEGDAIAGIAKQIGIFRFRLHAANNCASADHEYQLQVTGKPIVRVSPEELVFEYRAGDPPPSSRNVLVSSTWPELPYSVLGQPNWLRIRLRDGVTPYSGSAFAGDAATIEVRPQDLKPGVYEATLIFFARQGANPPSVPVKLKVLPASPAVATAQTAK
jgi:hypothetical protein